MGSPQKLHVAHRLAVTGPHPLCLMPFIVFPCVKWTRSIASHPKGQPGDGLTTAIQYVTLRN